MLPKERPLCVPPINSFALWPQLDKQFSSPCSATGMSEFRRAIDPFGADIPSPTEQNKAKAQSVLVLFFVTVYTVPGTAGTRTRYIRYPVPGYYS